MGVFIEDAGPGCAVVGRSVIPAKAGIHGGKKHRMSKSLPWVPAFARTTLRWIFQCSPAGFRMTAALPQSKAYWLGWIAVAVALTFGLGVHPLRAQEPAGPAYAVSYFEVLPGKEGQAAGLLSKLAAAMRYKNPGNLGYSRSSSATIQTGTLPLSNSGRTALPWMRHARLAVKQSRSSARR